MGVFNISSFQVQILCFLILVLTISIVLFKKSGSFFLFAFLLPFGGVIFTLIAYTIFEKDPLSYKLCYTIVFVLGNLLYVNALFRTKYAKDNLCKEEVKGNALQATYLDVSSICKEIGPLIRMFMYVLFLLGCLFLAVMAFLYIFGWVLKNSCTPITWLVFYSWLVHLSFVLYKILLTTYDKFVKPVLEKLNFTELFVLNPCQRRIYGFFEKNKEARRDPLVVFLGGCAFLRESQIFFVTIYVLFFRRDGGLSFCLISSLSIFTSVVTFLPLTREKLVHKYGPDALKQLGYNDESFFVKTLLRRGPKAVVLLGTIGVVAEVVVQVNATVEQFGINYRYNMCLDASIKAAKSAGLPHPTPGPIPQAPRRSWISHLVTPGPEKADIPGPKSKAS